jgi:hypothetical protein
MLGDWNDSNFNLKLRVKRDILMPIFQVRTLFNAGMGLGRSYSVSLYVIKRRRPGYEASCICTFSKWDTRTVQHMVVNAERKDC